MKKISILFLIVGLLAVTIDEVCYELRIRQHYLESATTSPTMMFVSALRGEQKKVTLPDGSIVWLNAASTLSYPIDIANGDRAVELSGEAFFDVAAKPSHPFKIRAREMLIEVLGTRFNVRNYPEEVSSQAFVVSGAIKVSYHDYVTTLHVGEEADVDTAELGDHAVALKREMDTATATAWTKGLLTFKDTDLRSLLRDLSRAYDVDIELAGLPMSHRFRTSVSLQEPLDQALERVIAPYAHVTISRPNKQRMILTVQH